MSSSSRRGSSALIFSLVACAVIGGVRVSPAAVELGRSQAAVAPVGASAAAPAKVVRHIVTSAINTTECGKITPDTAGSSMPFTSYHSNPWAVTGNDRTALPNDFLTFGTTFTGDFRVQNAVDGSANLKVEMPAVLASGGPGGMFR